jgi:hypothetical protein
VLPGWRLLMGLLLLILLLLLVAVMVLLVARGPLTPRWGLLPEILPLLHVQRCIGATGGPLLLLVQPLVQHVALPLPLRCGRRPTSMHDLRDAVLMNDCRAQQQSHSFLQPNHPQHQTTMRR